MKRLAAIGPVGILIVTGASAQTNPYTIRAGYSYAYADSGHGIGESSGYALGLGWDFMELKKTHTRISVDADYTNNNLRGDKIETASLELVGRMPFAHVKKFGFYAGAGIGIFQSLVSGSSTTSQFTGSQTILTTTSYSSQQTSFGGELVLGVRFDEHFGLEAFYRLVQINNGVNPNTIGVVAAFHF